MKIHGRVLRWFDTPAYRTIDELCASVIADRRKDLQCPLCNAVRTYDALSADAVLPNNWLWPQVHAELLGMAAESAGVTAEALQDELDRRAKVLAEENMFYFSGVMR
jgi:hypothetical protein